MKLVAHRGFPDEAPENTLPAIERAARLADAVEFDVRRCATGEPVVIHDETVDRVTDASGAVADFALADLRSLSVLGSEAGVPSLSAVVATLPAGTEVFVELKTPDVAADVLDVLAAHRGRTVVTSFSPAALDAVREIDASVPRGMITNDLAADPLGTARERGCDALLLDWRLAVLPWVYPRVRRSALESYAWTVRRRTPGRALSVLAFDGLVADGRYVSPSDP